jgi:hypothetical protein
MAGCLFQRLADDRYIQAPADRLSDLLRGGGWLSSDVTARDVGSATIGRPAKCPMTDKCPIVDKCRSVVSRALTPARRSGSKSQQMLGFLPLLEVPDWHPSCPREGSNLVIRLSGLRASMTAAPKFRIDVTTNGLLTSAGHRPPGPAEAKGLSLESPVFSQFPERVMESGPEAHPEKRKWGLRDILHLRVNRRGRSANSSLLRLARLAKTRRQRPLPGKSLDRQIGFSRGTD